LRRWGAEKTPYQKWTPIGVARSTTRTSASHGLSTA